MAKKAKRGRGRPRNDGLPVGTGPARSKVKAKKKASTKGLSRAPSRSAARSAVDLVAGKFIIASPAGILEKAPLPAHGEATGTEHQTAAAPVFSREEDARPISAYAVFDDKEEAELELDLLRRGGQRIDALDVALGLVPESGVAPPPPPPELEGASVVAMKTVFATSYEIEVNNELTRTVRWKDKATPLRTAVQGVRSELKEQLTVHEAALRDFDRRVAEARKANEMDVRKASLMLEKFNRAAETYA